MELTELRCWAERVSTGPVEDHSDRILSLPKNLLRFYWNGEPAVGVGSDAKDKLRINSVLNGYQWYFRRPGTVPGNLNIVLGCGSEDFTGAMKEHLGAICTLILATRNGPAIRLWSIESQQDPVELRVAETRFTPEFGGRKASDWNGMLTGATQDRVEGMARNLVGAVADDRLRLHPNVSDLTSDRRWQVRLDGADVGSVGDDDFDFKVKTRGTNPENQPLRGWIKAGLPIDSATGSPQGPIYSRDEVQRAAADVRRLIDVWSGGSSTALLDNRQPEHRLESRVLAGEIASTQLREGRIEMFVMDQAGKITEVGSAVDDCASPKATKPPAPTDEVSGASHVGIKRADQVSRHAA